MTTATAPTITYRVGGFIDVPVIGGMVPREIYSIAHDEKTDTAVIRFQGGSVRVTEFTSKPCPMFERAWY